MEDARSESKCERNGERTIRAITQAAFATPDEPLKMDLLRLLAGVEWPTASTLLHFCDSRPYPILDFRALWSLGYAKHVDNTTYVLAGREIDGGHLIGGDARRNFVLEECIAVQRAKVVVQEQPGVLTDARDHRATERIGRVPDHDLKWPVAPTTRYQPIPPRRSATTLIVASRESIATFVPARPRTRKPVCGRRFGH